jgi:hypothetical protein
MLLNDPPHVSPVPANPCAPTRKAGTITHSGRLGKSVIRGNVIMKATLGILILGASALIGASVLMTSGANAYRSNAQGYQSYPNPDRETYVNRSCCSWKTNRAKAKHMATKH